MKNTKKVYTAMNPPIYNGEPGGGEIHTVPDQTMTIRELMDSYARGVPSNSSLKEPVYNEDLIMMSPNHYDLTEIDEMRELYKQAQLDAEDLRKQLTDEINRRNLERDKELAKQYGLIEKEPKSQSDD